MVWLVFVALGFATGSVMRSRWSVIVWPAVSVALGIYVVADEAPDYDMHGFGYYLGGLAAAASVVAWLVGRLLRRRAEGRQ